MGLSKQEKGQINKGSGRLLLRIIIAAIICYMDSLLYQIAYILYAFLYFPIEVLDIIARNSRVEYHQEGEHVIDIKVYGTGFMSALVRNFLLRFNMNQTLDKVTSNHHCLPDPAETDDLIVGFIFGTYILVWVFMYFESFGLRMRHVIAGFFYRKREKKRVLHLYNEMFRRRIGFLATVRKRIRKSIKRKEYKRHVGFIVALQRQFPRWFKWLSVFQSAKENCIICEDSQGPGFHLCETPGCGIGYCQQCWKDVKKRCYACSRGEEDSDDEDENLSTDTSDLSGSE
ncbi:DC-STAMP domain-containing protein 1 [Plakobranchus ocellatus]|uniref:DC-STAMP domain-containing protein 1 n=1 Tax=Plakobranchus ocellatus TaxID=259542 RepID=A0AAV4CA31_9GAST|nr:DC-STAMP domain-containing protein 1 [Plakobranchus ocellatus]